MSNLLFTQSYITHKNKNIFKQPRYTLQQVTKFKSKKHKILVTSALPYANGPIHLGHLVEYIQTDIFVRFLRLIGEDVIYVCADDTHGAPIEIKAAELGIAPEKLIADICKEHIHDFNDFLISFDNYYTTHSPENKHYSDFIFERLNKNGFIYTKEIEVTYCEHCRRTLPDRYVKGKCPKCNAPEQYGDVCEQCNAAYKTIDLIEPYCSICKNRPIRKTSKHYFFQLSKFSGKLEQWLNKNKNLQQEIKNFVFNWIKNGLEDWNISRDGPYFGFKIPGEEDKYYYVWLDAPIGYISSTENFCKKNGLKAEDYWSSKNSRIYHFIGKDIIYFHFLFWPAMLIGSGFELPYDIVVHGFLTVNGEKMSKSRGTFFTAREFLQKHNAECLRFYYAGMLSKKMSDIDLNFDDFRKRINNELVANIGNFCYRVLNFLNKNFDGKINGIDGNKELIDEINKKIKDIEKNYHGLNFNEAVKDILYISSLGNKCFQDNEPWKLIKQDRERAHKIAGFCANIVKNLSILIQPVLPNLSLILQRQLNLQNLRWQDAGFKLKNHKIGKEEILVRKIDEAEEINLEQKFPEIKFEIDERVKELGLKFYAAQINNITIRKKNESLEKLKKEAENQAKDLNLESNRIYIEGKRLYKNKNFEPPYGYLTRLIKEKGGLPTINTVVDSYNIASIKHLISAGAHDAAKIKGRVRFTIANGSEKYIPLGGAQLEKIEEGEYACIDDEHVLCRLDVKQSEYTKVDDKTKSVMVYAQGNKENDGMDLKQSLKEICESIVKFCGGSYKILNGEEAKMRFPLNLKVAKIIDAQNHPNADKLYVLQIDLGAEKRQLVAGLKEHYTRDELLNKKIIVATNLKYAKLRGVESQGMLLAGDDGQSVGLLSVEESNPGDKAYFEGFDICNEELGFDDFLKIKMEVRNGRVHFDGKELRTNKETVKVEKVKDVARVR